jgi:uncharacterized SAM-binding protein YcdF (DUF218 family)
MERGTALCHSTASACAVRLLRKIFLCFLLCFGLWLGGLGWFIAHIPQSPVAETTKADAIVVLTGGSGRLEYGLELLAKGKGDTLFISGVGKGLTLEELLRHTDTPLKPALRKRIILGHFAENTIGNAQETARWLNKEGYKTILLVTANYHMPRSIEEFAQVSPGITIIPAPVFPENFTLLNGWRDTTSRILLLSEYHKFLAGKLRHWFVSATRHL